MHPIGIALLGLDVAAIALAVPAAWTALRALSGGSSSTGGVRPVPGRWSRAAAIGVPATTLFVILGGVLQVVAVAAVLPGDVPGAMCGAGVLEAMGRSGNRALVFRGMAVVLLWAAIRLAHLEEPDPEAPDPGTPLQAAASRAFLLALPLLILSAVESVRAFLALDGTGAVDCCSAVYGKLASGGGRIGGTAFWVVPASLVASALIPVLAIRILRSPSSRPEPSAWWLSLAGLAWVALSGAALIDHLSAYHFGLLAHRCPWCLFAVRYGAVGWPLFGALMLATLAALGMGVTAGAVRRVPSVREPARRQIRRCAIVLLAVDCLFLVIAWAPVIAWRLRNGAWIDA